MSLFAAPAARLTLMMACLFSALGVTLAFMPRWLEVERGLAGAEIGVVLSLAQGARILIGPLIAFWADGAADRRTPLRLVAIAAVAAYAAFFFLAHDFPSLLLTGFVALSLSQATTPLIESAALRATAQGRIGYGAARAIGSIAFIFANIAGGLLIARFGLGAVAGWVVTSLAFAALSSFALKPDPPPTGGRGGAARVSALKHLLRSRRFLLLLAACGLIQSAHAFYYGFSTLVWRGQGVAPETVGLLWAFAVAAEVVFLWRLGAIERRFSPEALIVLGAAGAVVRWGAMGFAPLDWLLWPLQALHALSFAAAHVGAMRLIAREAPDNAAAMAQTLYAGLSAGLLLGVFTFASGLLYDAAGARGYWAMAFIAGLGGLLALALPAVGARIATPR